MPEISRRNFMMSAAIGAASISTMGILAACSSTPEAKSSTSTENSSKTEYKAEVLEPTSAPNADTAHNFGIVPESKTTVGTTYENLMSAITGETGATTKYAAYAAVAEKEGFSQIARLFRCTSDAEKIHIELEYKLAQKIDPTTKKPEPPAVSEHTSDLNLIAGANGEIYETSDMYPSFIKKAREEGNNEAVQVFTRAKLAEAYHAQRYLDAYNTIDNPSEDKYYLCPICLAPKSSFTAY